MVAWELQKLMERTIHENDYVRHGHHLIMRLEGSVLNDLRTRDEGEGHNLKCITQQ